MLFLHKNNVTNCKTHTGGFGGRGGGGRGGGPGRGGFRGGGRGGGRGGRGQISLLLHNLLHIENPKSLYVIALTCLTVHYVWYSHSVSLLEVWKVNHF